MVQETQLKDLLERQIHTTPEVLTLVLDVDQNRSENLNRHFELAFRSLAARVRQETVNGTAGQFDKACRLAEQHLATYTPDGKTLALICDGTDGFVWTQTFQVPHETELHWDLRPTLTPLVELYALSPTYVVVSVNSGHARLMHVQCGRIVMTRTEDWTWGTKLRHVRTTGTDHIGSESHNQRRADNHLSAGLKQLASAIDGFCRMTSPEGIVLLGSAEVVSQLRTLLPQRLDHLVIGSGRVSGTATESQILAITLPMAERHTLETEASVVNDLLTLASKSTGRAVTGIVDLADAVNRGRLWKLVYAPGVRARGAECPGCGLLSVQATGPCEACGVEVRPVDAMDRLVDRVVRGGGHVEIVHAESAERLAEFGGVGGFLKFQQA